MPGGAVLKKTRHDLIADKVFGAAISYDLLPLNRLEKILSSPLAQKPIYQSSIPSCVACASSWLNQYNSYFESKNQVNLSWIYPYAQVKHFPGGTIPQEILDVIRRQGQCKDEQLPQEKFWDNRYWAENPNVITPEVSEGAEEYKISSYFFIQNPTLKSIYSYLKESPVLIGLTVDSFRWQNDNIIKPGNKDFQHMVVLVDIDEEWNLKVISWDKKDELDVRTLDKDYPIEMAIVIRDLPDGVAKDDIRRGTFASNLFRNLWGFL